MAASHWPRMMCRSVRQTPAPPTFTITSSGWVIFGSGMSSICGDWLNACKRTAFIGPADPDRPGLRQVQLGGLALARPAGLGVDQHQRVVAGGQAQVSAAGPEPVQ